MKFPCWEDKFRNKFQDIYRHHWAILSPFARNWAELRATVLKLRAIVLNCVELRRIARSLQGLQLRASKIHLRWKPNTLHAMGLNVVFLFHSFMCLPVYLVFLCYFWWIWNKGLKIDWLIFRNVLSLTHSNMI